MQCAALEHCALVLALLLAFVASFPSLFLSLALDWIARGVCRVLPLSIAAPVLALLLCRGCSGLPWGRCPGVPLAPLLAVKCQL